MGDQNRISITICGDGGCGKSSITLRLVRSQWTHEYDPTIEDSYSTTRTIDGRTYFLSLTDTAGQEEYRGLWAASNLKSDAFLLVYDITAASSLDTLDYFLQMIEMECAHRQDTGGVQPVKLVAGNKCDLKDSRVVSSRQGLEYARSRGCGFMETSAREMVNIEETFALIVRRVVAARQHAAGTTAAPPQRNQGLFSHAQSASRTQQLPSYGEKEADTTDFPERPGAKKTKRGGFWAKYKCW
ncbi:hypothetical protein HO173_006313 [Letharia columbiana]|uniref:Uncharacterized protein n=1 Tax=Letharia columbiana TaxID=112416 RepID=A0A8H6FVM5_9LECA|nr:uncharacterized protein HO173_006313 [Letharia columbiana]KAF6235630.1 hypothetical protein HO173_006313 [Letharia columbiana]